MGNRPPLWIMAPIMLNREEQGWLGMMGLSLQQKKDGVADGRTASPPPFSLLGGDDEKSSFLGS